LRLLLETHIWLWNFQEPRSLGRRASGYLQDRENELWLWPMSTWDTLSYGPQEVSQKPHTNALATSS